MYALNKYHFYALIAIFLILCGIFSACHQMLKTLRSMNYQLSIIRNSDKVKQPDKSEIPNKQTETDKTVSNMMGEYNRKS